MRRRSESERNQNSEEKKKALNYKLALSALLRPPKTSAKTFPDSHFLAPFGAKNFVFIFIFVLKNFIKSVFTDKRHYLSCVR